MRPKVHILGFLLACVLLASDVFAQQQKTGYVNTNLIISRVPEYESIEQELRSVSQQWRDELKEMQHEIDELKEEFAAREILYTEEIRNQREKEIQNKIRLREQYMDQKFGPEGEYFQHQKELLKPVQRKIFEAISVVAEREGFDFVIDRAQNSTLLFARTQWNLNDEVLLQMGINSDDTSN